MGRIKINIFGSREERAKADLLSHLRNAVSLIEGTFRLKEGGKIDEAKLKKKLTKDLPKRIRRSRAEVKNLIQLEPKDLECINDFLDQLEQWLTEIQEEKLDHLKREYEAVYKLLVPSN